MSTDLIPVLTGGKNNVLAHHHLPACSAFAEDLDKSKFQPDKYALHTAVAKARDVADTLLRQGIKPDLIISADTASTSVKRTHRMAAASSSRRKHWPVKCHLHRAVCSNPFSEPLASFSAPADQQCPCRPARNRA